MRYSLISVLRMTNFCVAIFLSYLSRKKGVSFHKQEVLLMVAASTTLQRLWTCRPPTYMYTNFTFCRTDTHSPVCVSDTTQCRGEGINLHSDGSVLQVTAQRSPLTHSSAGVAATASALIFNQTQTGRNWSSAVFSVKVVARLLNFWKFGKKKKKWSLVPITLHFNEWVHSIVCKWENSYVIYCEFFIVYLLYKFCVYFANL